MNKLYYNKYENSKQISIGHLPCFLLIDIKCAEKKTKKYNQFQVTLIPYLHQA